MDKKAGYKLLFFALLIFWFSKPAFAALTITDVSKTTVNSPDDIVTITATASGLSSSIQYLQVAFTKEGNPTNYLGLTKNTSDEWYLYKSSPTASDLSAYFYSFTPVGSTWSGQIQAKFDVNDDGFQGPGNYIIKLFKYISSSGSPSNNSFIISVNIASPSSQTNPESSSPQIAVDINDSYKLGETFRLGLTLSNFPASKNYYLKFRAGTEESTLNKGQTKNDTGFYADNESWDKFPKVKTSDSGSWEGELSGQIAEDKPEGKYKIRIRVKSADSDTLYDSEIKEANFLKPAVTLASVPVLINKSTSSGKRTTSSPAGEILGTGSAIQFYPATPASKPGSPKSEVQKKSEASNYKLLVLAGGLSLLIAIFLGLGGGKLWGIIKTRL